MATETNACMRYGSGPRPAQQYNLTLIRYRTEYGEIVAQRSTRLFKLLATSHIFKSYGQTLLHTVSISCSCRRDVHVQYNSKIGIYCAGLGFRIFYFDLPYAHECAPRWKLYLACTVCNVYFGFRRPLPYLLLMHIRGIPRCLHRYGYQRSKRAAKLTYIGIGGEAGGRGEERGEEEMELLYQGPFYLS